MISWKLGRQDGPSQDNELEWAEACQFPEFAASSAFRVRVFAQVLIARWE
jgi:hypothetical protein